MGCLARSHPLACVIVGLLVLVAITLTIPLSTPPSLSEAEVPDDGEGPLAVSPSSSPVLEDGRTAAISAQAAAVPCAVPTGGTLRLPPAREVGHSVPHHPASCPSRFIFVNTHTFGRHHNQLQEMMNLVLWAERLNRTAVLGWFRHNHAWIDPAEFYNFTEISRRFCLVTADAMIAMLDSSSRDGGRSATALTTECFGQGIKDTPLKHLLRRRSRCTFVPGVQRYYNSRYGMRVTRTYLPLIMQSRADIVVLGGEIAFFMRAGLANIAALYGHLQPSSSIAAEVNNFAAAKLRPHQRDAQQGSEVATGYLALHSRQRERECLKEVSDSFADGAHALQTISAAERTVIAAQCALTLDHVLCLQRSLGLLPRFPVFLASDHQNVALEKALLADGAVMFDGTSSVQGGARSLGPLQTMAVDFFLMIGARYFSGNQLSSVTQNACYVRLGRGLGCHGVVEAFTRYHARDLLDEPLTSLHGLQL